MVISCKCSDVTFKLSDVAAAKGKSKEAATEDFKVDIPHTKNPGVVISSRAKEEQKKA